MPPSNKRSRDESSDSEQRLTKGSKLGNAFSFPSHNVPTETTSPDAPERLLASSSSSTSSSATRSTRAQPASKNRREREYLYRNELARLNYNANEFCKSKLQSNDISNEGFYVDFAYKYMQQAHEIKQKYNASHGDVAVCGSGEMGQLGLGESITESRKLRTVANLRNQNIHQIAAGGLHNVALNQDGQVYTWGCSDEGSLGVLDPPEDGYLPSRVTGFYPSQYGPNGTSGLLDEQGNLLPYEQRPEANILQVDAGNTQSLALSSVGDVYEFGSLKDNEGRNFRVPPPPDDTRDPIHPAERAKIASGEEQLKYVTVPRGRNFKPVHVLFKQRVVQLSAGENFNAAILADNTTIMTWGIDLQGEMSRPVCGMSKETDNELILKEHLTPHPALWAGPEIPRRVLQVSCGGWHLLVSTREGTNQELSVYSSGLNNYGQLGHGMCEGENGMEEDTNNRERLTKVKFFEGKDVEKVEGGYHNSFFVGGRGKKLYSAGRGDYGALGITYVKGEIGFFVSTPARVPLVYDVRSQGDISNPTQNCIVEETINEEEQPEIEQVAAGGSHVMVITKEGDVYTWGFGEMGQCGQNKTGAVEEDEDITLPQKMNLVRKKKKMEIKYVSSGSQHSAAIVSTSDLFGGKF